jgi:DNA-binding protein H-NS
LKRKKRDGQKNDQVRKKLEKQANEIGMTLKPREPLPVVSTPRRSSESPIEEEQDEHPHVKGKVYRHPTDEKLVWTAQLGRKPNWLRQLLREGHKLEDLKVQSVPSSEQPTLKMLFKALQSPIERFLYPTRIFWGYC